MANELMAVLGCDCDPDRPRYGGSRYDDRKSPLRWKCIEEGTLLLRERLQKINDATGANVKIVFFLRSDTQINELHGKSAWPVLEYAGTWQQLEEEGHELAWHPHLWRWSSDWKCWFQETEDSGWIGECLHKGHEGISTALGRNPVSCHMGWTYQNNTSMGVLSKLGVKIDLSASPGVYSQGGPGDAGTRYDNMVDWRGSPQAWYRPSAIDYRRPAKPQEEELSIVELPKFTSGSVILKGAKGLASGRGRDFASKRATAVFVQVTASPIVYNRIINERLKTEEAEPFFATYFHLDELLPDRPRSARGLLYSLSNLEKNILGLIKAAEKTGRTVRFITGAEAYQHISSPGQD